MFVDYQKHRDFVAELRAAAEAPKLSGDELSLASEYGRDQVRQGKEAFDTIDRKAAMLSQSFGAIGVLSAIVLLGMADPIDSIAVKASLVAALACVASSSICALIAMWPRRLPTTPELSELIGDLAKHKALAVSQAMPIVYAGMVAGWKVVNAAKLSWLQAGYALLSVAMVLVVAFISLALKAA